MAGLFFAVARRMRFVPFILLPMSVLILAYTLLAYPTINFKVFIILVSCLLLYAALVLTATSKLSAHIARVVLPIALTGRVAALTYALKSTLDDRIYGSDEKILMLLLAFQLAACVGAGVAVALNRPYGGSRNFTRLFSLCAMAGGLLAAYQYGVYFLDIFRRGEGLTGYSNVLNAGFCVMLILESLFFIQLGVFFGAVTRGGGDFLPEQDKA